MKAEKKCGVFLVNNKIIIQTENRKNEGTWYGSATMTILDIVVSNKDVGEIILHCLSFSKTEDIAYERIKEYWKNLIKKSNSKTENFFFENTKYLSVEATNDLLIITPFKTCVSRRAFARTPNEVFEISQSSGFSEIGSKIIEALNKCIIII